MQNIRKYAASTVTVMVVGGVLVSSASAEAATGSSAQPSACTHSSTTASYYGQTNPYTEAKWTSNSCGYLLQVRAWCLHVMGGGAWATSGVVKSVGLWDKATCGELDTLAGTYIRFSYNGGSTWTAYQSYSD